VDIAIRNTASASTDRPGRNGGRGLSTIEAELRPFNGRLAPITDLTTPWTYGTHIYLERWRIL